MLRRAAACRSAHRAHSRMRRRRRRVGRGPDLSRIPFRLRDLDSTAHQQSLPRQSLHTDAGTERPLSFRGENRRRDLPDVPGLRRDSECYRRLDRSAADFLSRRRRLDRSTCFGTTRRMALIVAILMPANFVLAWMYANSLRAAFIDERETTAPRNNAHRGNARVDQNRQSLRHRGSRSGKLRARELGRVPCRPPRTPDARAIPRHHQHRSRSGVRRGAVRRRDGSDGGWNRRPRARRRFARTVPGIDYAWFQT